MLRHRPPERPAIWAEGRQHPPFEMRAFARASLILAREGMAGVLQRCALSAQALGAGVQAGRWTIPAHRLGRSGRLLPSHRAVGRGMRAGAELLQAASETVLPLADRLPEDATPPPPMVTIMRPGKPDGAGAAAIPSAEEADLAEIRALLAGPRRRARAAAAPLAGVAALAGAPADAAAVPAATPPAAIPAAIPAAREEAREEAREDAGEDADLAAVRALMAGFADDPEPEPEPLRPAPAPPAAMRPANPAEDVPAEDIPAEDIPRALPPDAAAPQTPPPGRAAPRWLVRPLGAGLGYGLLVMALPYGLARATLAHLMGEDLRKLA